MAGNNDRTWIKLSVGCALRTIFRESKKDARQSLADRSVPKQELGNERETGRRSWLQ